MKAAEYIDKKLGEIISWSPFKAKVCGGYETFTCHICGSHNVIRPEIDNGDTHFFEGNYCCAACGNQYDHKEFEKRWKICHEEELKYNKLNFYSEDFFFHKNNENTQLEIKFE